MFIYTIYVRNINLNLIQLNPDRCHSHSKLLATAHHPFSAPKARGEKSSTILARIWRIFCGRLLFYCRRLSPQLLCHLPGSSQKNSNCFTASASLDLLLLNPFMTWNVAHELPHLLTLKSLLLVALFLQTTCSELNMVLLLFYMNVNFTHVNEVF